MTRIIIDWKTKQRLCFRDKPSHILTQRPTPFQDSLKRIPYPIDDLTKLDVIAHTWMPDFYIEGMDHNIRF